MKKNVSELENFIFLELVGWKKDIIENYARQLMLERLRDIQAIGLPIYTKSQYPSKIISNVAFR